MANIVEHELTQSLFEALQKERYVILTTVDPQSGIPNVNAISWTLAKDFRTLLFSVAGRSKIVDNIRSAKHAVITIMANESTYSISGEANVKAEKVEGISLDLVLIELKITEVRDVMFYGSKLTVEPQYEIAYDHEAAKALDIKVMDAMRKA